MFKLQQRLPFTVLKLKAHVVDLYFNLNVATALTVYGIETNKLQHLYRIVLQVATALTVYGIET